MTTRDTKESLQRRKRGDTTHQHVERAGKVGVQQGDVGMIKTMNILAGAQGAPMETLGLLRIPCEVTPSDKDVGTPTADTQGKGGGAEWS